MHASGKGGGYTQSVEQHKNKPCHIKRINHSPTPNQNLTKFIRGCYYICRDTWIEICIHNSERIQLCNVMPPNLQGVPRKRRTDRRKRRERRTVTQRTVWTVEEVRLGQSECENHQRQKNRDRRTQSNVNSTLNEYACNHTEHHKQFSPGWWNPIDTGALSKFTQLMPKGSSLAIWWPLTCEQGNSTYKLTEVWNHRLIFLIKRHSTYIFILKGTQLSKDI